MTEHRVSRPQAAALHQHYKHLLFHPSLVAAKHSQASPGATGRLVGLHKLSSLTGCGGVDLLLAAQRAGFWCYAVVSHVATVLIPSRRQSSSGVLLVSVSYLSSDSCGMGNVQAPCESEYVAVGFPTPWKSSSFATNLVSRRPIFQGSLTSLDFSTTFFHLVLNAQSLIQNMPSSLLSTRLVTRHLGKSLSYEKLPRSSVCDC